MSAVKIEKNRQKEANMKVSAGEEKADAAAGKPCIDFEPGDRWQIKDEGENNIETVSPPAKSSRKRKGSRRRRRNNSSRTTAKNEKSPVEVNGEVTKELSDGVVASPEQNVDGGKCNNASSEATDKSQTVKPDCTNGDGCTVNRKRSHSPSSDVGSSTKKNKCEASATPSKTDCIKNDKNHLSNSVEDVIGSSKGVSEAKSGEGVKSEVKDSNDSAATLDCSKNETSDNVVTSSGKTETTSKENDNLIVVSDGESDNDIQVITSTSDTKKNSSKENKPPKPVGKSVADFSVSHNEETLMSAGFPYLNSLQEKLKDLQPGKYKPVKFPHTGTLMLEENEVIIESPSLLVPLLIKERDKFPPVDGEQEKAANGKDEEKSAKQNTAAPRKNFFQSSVGEFMINLGASRVTEWYHRDMKRFKLRQSRKSGYNKELEEEIIQHSQKYQSLKEANGPFNFSLMKCQLCDFKTESLLIMDSHYMIPHMSSRREFKCNFCKYMTRDCREIIVHFNDVHKKRAVLEDQMSLHECLFCSFQSHLKAKVNVHMNRCRRNFIPTQNLSPPFDFEFPGVTTKPVTIADVIAHRRMLLGSTKSGTYPAIGQAAPTESFASVFARKKLASVLNMTGAEAFPDSPTLVKHLMGQQGKQGATGLQLPPGLMLTRPRARTPQVRQGAQGIQPRFPNVSQAGYVQSIGSAASQLASSGVSITPVGKQDSSSRAPIGAGLKNVTLTPISSAGNQIVSQKPGPPQPVALFTNVAGSEPLRNRAGLAQPGRVQPNLPGKAQRLMAPYQRLNTPPSQVVKSSSGSSFVMCEICDSYIKDLDELRSHMNWVHKVKIHPKMLVSRPPLNCQKCQWRFFTDQGLERHLLGAHGLVTTNMQEMANKNQDGGRCIICGAVFTYKLVSHMTQVHKVTLKPAHLSYKCTVCTATFTLYRLFESHVYNVHSSSAKRSTEESSDPPNKKPNVAKASPAPREHASDKKKTEQKESKTETHQGTKAQRCRDCQVVTEDLLSHIKEKHMKECKVKLCRIEKCQKCLYSSDEMLVIRLDQLGISEDESSDDSDEEESNETSEEGGDGNE